MERAATIGPTEKLYLMSSSSYHMLIAVKSRTISLPLGWMLFIVAATIVDRLWLVSKDSKKTDNFALSQGVKG